MSQLIKFIMVGSSAALIHLTSLHIMVRFFELSPLYANIIAFFIAFTASYVGQSFWTFNHRSQRHTASVARFLITQLLCSLLLNQGLYTLLLAYTSLHYLFASILVLLLVSAMTFTISKYWVFQ